MPTVLNSPVPTNSLLSPKKKFRTVLGLGSLTDSPSAKTPESHQGAFTDDENPVLITTRNSSSRRTPSSPVTDTEFYNNPNASSLTNGSYDQPAPASPKSDTSSLVVEEMKIDLSQLVPPQPAAPAARLYPQLGPWAISAAETPHVKTTYNLYIKTPTHHLTLTRTAKEITELHTRLRDSFPNLTLPPLPISPTQPSQKRRGSFLHTLSRFTNGATNNKINGAKPNARPSTAHASSASASQPSGSVPASLPTPLTSPTVEFSDPFSATIASSGDPMPVPHAPKAQSSAASNNPNGPTNLSSTNTASALAAYLTTLANDPKLRTSRPWKRFIRVRTDDLQSARIERAIKRVRSDVAIHSSTSTSVPMHGIHSAAPSFMTLGLALGGGAGSGSLGLGGLGMSIGNPSEAESAYSVETNGAKGATPGDQVSHQDDEDLRNAHAATAWLAAHDRDATVTSANALLNTPAVTPAGRPLSAAAAPLPPSPSPEEAPLTPTPADIPLPTEADPEFASVPPSPRDNRKLHLETQKDQEHAQRNEIDIGLPTPVQSPHAAAEVDHEAHAHPHPHARIPRSASADPDKASRRARELKPSPLNPTSLSSGSADGDSASAPGDETMTDIDVLGDPETDGNAADTAPPKKKVLKKRKVKKASRKVVVDDFDMMRVLGKGCAGKVLLVKHKESGSLYALKAITKRHVLAHQELQHTLTEQAVLKRMAREGRDPFVVKLWWSFHDKDNLFLVMDFHPGGDLATQLARWGRLGRDRARFYAAEIVEGVDGLHAAGVVYRDLKPENILIGADGHIVLTDFGLSKEFPRPPRPGDVQPTTPTGTSSDFYSATNAPTQAVPYWMIASAEDKAGLGTWAGPGAVGSPRHTTTTFCGTAEYLAPEVIQGLPYSYEVDWWSFGTMLYEMLSGITPFWANNHSDMYVRVLQDELTFPDDKAMDHDTKSLIRGLLQRNPALRMSEPRIKRHPYFSMIDWEHVYYKRYIPPYVPPIDPSNASDTQNFDEAFLDMDPTIDNDAEADGPTDSEREKTEDDRTDAESVGTSGPSSVNGAPVKPAVEDHAADVFDGYSFKGRHSLVLDDEDKEDGLADEEDEDVDDALEAMDAASRGVLGQQPDAEADKVPDRDSKFSAATSTGTLEIPNETEGSAVGGVETETASLAPSSAAQESPVTASMTTEGDVEEATTTVVPAQPPSRHGEVTKQYSQSSEDTSVPSVFTNGTTPSGESPLTTPADSIIMSAARGAKVVDGEEVDVALQAPLPLSPIFEQPALPLVKDDPQEVETPAAVTPAARTAMLPNSETPVPGARTTPALLDVPVTPTRHRHSRREKSGIAALDKVMDDDAAAHEDDWDLIETPHGEDRNGAKVANLWQRGVVDRYRLAVFKKDKEKKPTSRSAEKQRAGGSGEHIPRSTSGVTIDSEGADPTMSPSPSESKHRRGRTAGISLRKSTKQFLRAKSPSTTWSVHSSAASRASLAQSATAAMAVNSNGLLTPSPSMPATLSRPPASSAQSLKSKSSALSKNSVGSPGSSDQSTPDLKNMSKSASDITSPLKSPTSPRLSPPGDGDNDKLRNLKKMRKYTEERAEKMFSIFASSPRTHHQQALSPPPHGSSSSQQ